MAQAVGEVLELLAENWRTIAKLIGVGVLATTGYELGKAVVGSGEAFKSAVSISSYAIPVAVYSMVFQMVMSTIRAISEMTRSEMGKATATK